MTKTIKVPQQLFRAATIDRESVNPEKKTLRMSISSDTPYLRYDYWNDEEYYEILDHTKGGMDEDRLKAGLPILFNHKRDSHLGRATSYENDGHKCSVEVAFSESDFAQEKMRDAMSGVLPDTSVGYEIEDEGECIGAKDGRPIYKFKWTPYEASLVTVPADISVGVGRQRQKPEGEPKEISVELKKEFDDVLKNENRLKTAKAKHMEPNDPPVKPEPKIDVKEVASNTLTAERGRVKQINDYVAGLAKHPAWQRAAAEVAIKAIETGQEFDAFRTAAILSFDGVQQVVDTPELGLNRKEKAAFSLLKAIRTLANKQPLEGLEKEVSIAAAKAARLEMRPDAIYLPDDINNYDLRDNPDFSVRAFEQFVRANQNVTTATAGGFTVATMLGSLIELLRNATVLGRAGITTIGGLQGDLAFPQQTGGATAAWVSESGTLSDSAATFAQKVMTPKRLGATIPFTTQFLAQTSLSAEQFVRNELMTVSGIALDLAGLEGTGFAGQPLGVKGTPGVGADITFSGAAAWGKVVDFETYINVANADIGSMAFILSSATVGKWKQILKVTAGAAGQFLIENNTANGYPVLRTNQITGNIAFFGVWSQLLHAMWATQEIIVDPYALKKSGGIEVTMNSFHDYLVRQPAAFEVSTDTAAI